MLTRSILLALCLSSCAISRAQSPQTKLAMPVSLTLIDQSRHRPISVLLYGKRAQGQATPLAIISHGYGGHNGDYSFIANDLVARGYLVASIEHTERPGDAPMVNSGDLATLRRPVWQVGADTIDFVIDEMGRRGFATSTVKPIIIGHSNGGDMTMLYATEHPEKIGIALSLDNRRMPLPHAKIPKICSIRSSNFNADPGVLPSADDQRDLGMSIVTVAVKHDDMWDGGTAVEKEAILKGIATCIDKPVGSASFQNARLRPALS